MKCKEIKAKRKLVGITVEELAKRCGVTRQQIFNIENEHCSGSVPLLRVIDYELGKAFIETKYEDIMKNLFLND